MSLTYLEAMVVGPSRRDRAVPGVQPRPFGDSPAALIGGQWARRPERLRAGIAVPGVHRGLHVATAMALLVFFWRDWVRIAGGSRVLRSATAGCRRTRNAGLVDHSGHHSVGWPGCCWSTPSVRCWARPVPAAAVPVRERCRCCCIGEWLRRRAVQRTPAMTTGRRGSERIRTPRA